jgi:uncharacterized protein YndB with AHSA1/START domain
VTEDSAAIKTPKTLLLSRLWPPVSGALAGVALRVIFSGRPDGPMAAMSMPFIYLVPILVGAVTVYFSERQKRRTWGYYARAAALANVWFVLGTLLIFIEGLICAVLIVPLFATLGALGGLLMGAICRYTNWPKQAVSLCVALPLALGGLATEPELPTRYGNVDRSVVVDAPPERVWHEILYAPAIHGNELEPTWLYRIGVPRPTSGITRPAEHGLVRRVTMGKGIYFDEVFAEVSEPSRLRWTYRFYKDSFPPGSLDEHVVIGGNYFDVRDTEYTLTPEGSRTLLTVRVGYRVSTQFNWYAYPLSRFLLGNLAESNLAYYRRRAVGPAG